VQGGGCGTVGVAGLVQGGGFGTYSKRFGTAGSSLLSRTLEADTNKLADVKRAVTVPQRNDQKRDKMDLMRWCSDRTRPRLPTRGVANVAV
jgi:hypothetical protein